MFRPAIRTVWARVALVRKRGSRAHCVPRVHVGRVPTLTGGRECASEKHVSGAGLRVLMLNGLLPSPVNLHRRRVRRHRLDPDRRLVCDAVHDARDLRWYVGPQFPRPRFPRPRLPATPDGTHGQSLPHLRRRTLVCDAQSGQRRRVVRVPRAAPQPPSCSCCRTLAAPWRCHRRVPHAVQAGAHLCMQRVRACRKQWTPYERVGVVSHSRAPASHRSLACAVRCTAHGPSASSCSPRCSCSTSAR